MINEIHSRGFLSAHASSEILKSVGQWRELAWNSLL
jgi:hypothetical protein